MKCLTKERFSKILVEQFELESITNNELKKEYLNNLYTIIDNLYDCSKDMVESLSKEETYIFRKKYGILDLGICQTYADLSNELGVPERKVYSIVNIACRKIRNYSVSNVKLPCTENNSSIIKEDISPILLITIDKIDLSNRVFNCLQRARIFTLGDLVKLSIKDLDKIPNLGLKSKSEIVKRVHECGLKFALEDESKRKIERPVDPETYLRNYEILKEEEKIALIKQRAFLKKIQRLQLMKANDKKNKKNVKIKIK